VQVGNIVSYEVRSAKVSRSVNTRKIQESPFTVRARQSSQVRIISSFAVIDWGSILLACRVIHKAPAAIVVEESQVWVCVKNLVKERQQTGASHHREVCSIQPNVARGRNDFAGRVKAN